ncbi:gamma-tubulin complex component 5-like [Rhinoderma darwinii]|uniref:gamma-tubulin complex component 5-like n=1 Tax=Rhinoderma darwinii TaxID=43563 RepID=UPI003F6710DB
MAHWTRYEREQEKDVRKLISSLSGLDDESDNNYQLALQYAGSNFRYRRKVHRQMSRSVLVGHLLCRSFSTKLLPLVLFVWVHHRFHQYLDVSSHNIYGTLDG